MNRLDKKHETLDVSELIVPFVSFSNQNNQISLLSKDRQNNSNHNLKSLLKKELDIII